MARHPWAVKQPLGVAHLDHAAVEVARRGVDVLRLARRALTEYGDAPSRATTSPRSADPRSARSRSRIALFPYQCRRARGLMGTRVDVARGVGERAVADTDPRSLERELELEHRVLLVVQRRVERRGGLRVRGGNTREYQGDENEQRGAVRAARGAEMVARSCDGVVARSAGVAASSHVDVDAGGGGVSARSRVGQCCM